MPLCHHWLPPWVLFCLSPTHKINAIYFRINYSSTFLPGVPSRFQQVPVGSWTYGNPWDSLALGAGRGARVLTSPASHSLIQSTACRWGQRFRALLGLSNTRGGVKVECWQDQPWFIPLFSLMDTRGGVVLTPCWTLLTLGMGKISPALHLLIMSQLPTGPHCHCLEGKSEPCLLPLGSGLALCLCFSYLVCPLELSSHRKLRKSREYECCFIA